MVDSKENYTFDLGVKGLTLKLVILKLSCDDLLQLISANYFRFCDHQTNPHHFNCLCDLLQGRKQKQTFYIIGDTGRCCSCAIVLF